MAARPRPPVSAALSACGALVALAPAAHASGAGAVAFVTAVIVTMLQALLATMICEVGVSLLLVDPARRRSLAWLHAGALVAGLICVRLPWLGPSLVALPIVIAWWSTRRPVALGLVVGAAALGALGGLSASLSIVLVVGLVIPFLPIGIALYREGRPRAAVASVMALASGFLALLWSMGPERLGGRPLWLLLVFAAAATPLAVFLAREGKRRVAAATLAGVPLLLWLMGRLG